VLESSPGLEVIELTCPAEHETLADHDLVLPTAAHHPSRVFAGQTFVHHVGDGAPWQPGPLGGLEHRDLGLTAATGGLASACVVRPHGEPSATLVTAPAELAFSFVLSGSAQLQTTHHGDHDVGAGDAVALPPGEGHRFAAPSADLELLQVHIPAT
jgi:hypothetical protein